MIGSCVAHIYGNHPPFQASMYTTAMKSLLTGIALIAFALLILKLVNRMRLDRQTLPPGPNGRFLFGNLFEIPKEYEYKLFRQWSKIYGDAMYLSVAGTSLLVLDSLEAAQDLLEKRSAIYSNRPHSTMLSDVIGWSWSVVLMNPGKMFNKYRRIFHQGLYTSQDDFAQVQKEETDRLVKCLHESPQEFLSHIARWSKRTILQVTYGYCPQSDDDRYIELSNLCVEAIIRAGQPGAYLVDVIPLLRWIPSWFPGASFQKEGEKWRKLVKEVLESPMAYALNDIHNGISHTSFVNNLIQTESWEAETGSPDLKAIKETAAIVHTAGADSLFSVMQSFILAMVLFPEVQRKAQNEINLIIGNGSPPPYTERERLPYVHKVFLETLRWARVAPLGIAHQAICDDNYRGMYIPSGTVVMANVWSISMNEKLYPAPEEFRPERFDDPSVPDPHLFAFGFGKRVCAGKDYAEKMLWLGICSVLSNFVIRKARDNQGREITPAVDYTPGLICYPKPFLCEFTKIEENGSE
ncbi:cytochrome P450 [Flammula alnicola]|nr:cytochrome P450 [Flammula alnicola]